MNKRACIHSTPIELRKRVVHKNLSNLIKNVTGSVKLHFSFACILVCLKQRDTHFYFIVFFFSHRTNEMKIDKEREKNTKEKKGLTIFHFFVSENEKWIQKLKHS